MSIRGKKTENKRQWKRLLIRKVLMFKICESGYWIWPGASYIYVLFMLLISIINKLQRGLGFWSIKLNIVTFGWDERHGENFPFSDVSDPIPVTTFLSACLEALEGLVFFSFLGSLMLLIPLWMTSLDCKRIDEYKETTVEVETETCVNLVPMCFRPDFAPGGLLLF